MDFCIAVYYTRSRLRDARVTPSCVYSGSTLQHTHLLRSVGGLATEKESNRFSVACMPPYSAESLPCAIWRFSRSELGT